MSPRENPYLLPSRDSFGSVDSALQENEEAEYSTDDDDYKLHSGGETSSSSKLSSRKRVAFGSIQVREYNRTIGDNPSVRVGVPVSLDWQFSERAEVPIDEYEENRPPRKAMLRLSSITRRNILLNVWGYTEEDIADADKEIQKIKRRQSHGSGAVETTARKAGKVGRKLRKGIAKSIAATSRMMAPQLMMQAY